MKGIQSSCNPATDSMSAASESLSCEVPNNQKKSVKTFSCADEGAKSTEADEKITFSQLGLKSQTFSGVKTAYANSEKIPSLCGSLDSPMILQRDDAAKCRAMEEAGMQTPSTQGNFEML